MRAIEVGYGVLVLVSWGGFCLTRGSRGVDQDSSGDAFVVAASSSQEEGESIFYQRYFLCKCLSVNGKGCNFCCKSEEMLAYLFKRYLFYIRNLTSCFFLCLQHVYPHRLELLRLSRTISMWDACSDAGRCLHLRISTEKLFSFEPQTLPPPGAGFAVRLSLGFSPLPF